MFGKKGKSVTQKHEDAKAKKNDEAWARAGRAVDPPKNMSPAEFAQWLVDTGQVEDPTA